MIDRRDLLILLGAAALTPATLRAQTRPAAGKVWRIGVLLGISSPDEDPSQSFRQRLRELGHVEGKNLVIDWRYSEGRERTLPGLAAELVGLNVDVIVAEATDGVRAAMKATSTIPIVMAFTDDPVADGLVSDLAHPGGNVTGNSVMLAETSVKRLQLLKEAAPRISRVAVLWNSARAAVHKPMLKGIDAAAPSLGLEVLAIAVRSRDDLGDALQKIKSGRANALLVSQTMSPAARRQLLEFAAKNRLPAIYINKEYVAAGGLMSYSFNRTEMFGQAAVYVDKILKGAKPGELPVQQPTKFELVVNKKTARRLGITIPHSILLLADQVIE